MINKSKLLNRLLQKKTRDYTYTILFFLIFSFFIIFAIKPSLNTAFSLKKKLADLKKIDSAYESEIVKVVDLQKKLETVRDDLHLLTDALPEKVAVNKLINDIKQISDKNNISLNQINFDTVQIKENPNQGKLTPIAINLDINAKFKDFNNFMTDVHNQRRFKLIKNFSIQAAKPGASGSAQLKLTLQLSSYYL